MDLDKTSHLFIAPALQLGNYQHHNNTTHSVKMTSIPGVNLPWLVLGHSIFLSFLGLRMIFRSSPPPRPNRENEISAISGITTLAIGIAYLVTSYMPIEQNQFLHASVPVRIFLALLAALRLCTISNISNEGRNEMLFVAIYDGLGGAICGWQLGNFSGRVPAQ